jgi:probable H4MPT-linked C1 transfer pathway protein
LDIGGAHLKVAQTMDDGRVIAAVQVPCALWQGLDRLERALAEAAAGLAPIVRTAVTMTGELADLFPDRATGVRSLLDAVTASLPHARHRVWAGRLGFVAPSEAAGCADAIASANWLASATLAARRADGLFVDMGSTTTDVLVLAGGAVRAGGFTDRERLATGELVYTGLTRTPLMAVAKAAPFRGRWISLMNEHFATVADAWRVLGVLPEAADQHPAADNGPKSIEASARRLGRMVGADLGEGDDGDWRRLAGWFAACQTRAIEDAVLLQLSRGLVGERPCLVGAGCGRFVVEALAGRLDLPYRDFASLVEAGHDAGAWTATCAPAVAVALLAAEEDGWP